MKGQRTLVVAVSTVLLLVPVPSSAVTSTQSGWWTSSPITPSPDVPEGGILLQGGPSLDRPVAYGAVSFTLSANERPGTLTLAVAANSATTPNASITVCPLTRSFTASDGGPTADAPTFDCAAKATASRSDDGRTFTVDTAAFLRTSAVAVALLPTVVTDRIVLEPIDAASLSTSTPTAPPVTSVVSGGSGGGSVSQSPPATGAPSVGSVTPVPTSAPAVSQPASPAAPAGAPAVATSPAGGAKKSSTPGIAFIALLVSMGALWLFAGSPHEDAVDAATVGGSTSSGGLLP